MIWMRAGFHRSESFSGNTVFPYLSNIRASGAIHFPHTWRELQK
jgi:hypothetical protein